jgi:hypothetical protein
MPRCRVTGKSVIFRISDGGFTAKKAAEAARSDPVIARQIEELQQAAAQNAQSVHVLAVHRRGR